MGPDLAGDYECHLEPLRPNKSGKTKTTETHSSSHGGAGVGGFGRVEHSRWDYYKDTK